MARENQELQLRIAELEAAKDELRRTEETLRENENKYKFLVDNSKEVILIINKKGKIIFANKNTLADYGYSEEELIGKSIVRFLTRDCIKKTLYALAQEFLGHPYPEMEIRAKTKSDEIRYLKVTEGSTPVYSKGKLIGVMVNARDVTESRKAEEKLRKSEERFRELWDHAPFAYHTLDLKGIITSINQTGANLLAYTKEEMVGHPIFDFILPEQRAEAEKRFQQKISSCPTAKEANRIYVKKDGSKIYVTIDDVLERNKDGKVIGIRTTMVDVTKERKAEEAVKKSEELFRDLVEKADVAISVDDQEGNLKYFNKRYAEIFGYSMEEMKKCTIWTIVHPDDIEKLRTYHSRRYQGKDAPTRYELKGIRKDGSAIYLEVDVVVLKGGQRIVGARSYIWDITERKRAEEALARERYLMQALMDNIPDYIYFKDRESQFIRISKAHSQSFGLSDPAQALGKTDFDFFTEEHARKAYEDEQKIIQTGQPVMNMEEKETRHGRPDAWVLTTKMPLRDREGRIVGTFGISRDITERKQAEKALLESERKLRLLAESMRDVVFIYDMNHRLQYVNPAFEELTGYSMKEAYEQNFIDYLHPEDRERMTKLWEELFQGKSLSGEEFRINTKEGKTKWCSSSWGPLLDEEGNQIGVQGREMDITKRKLAEEILQKSEAKYRALFECANDAVFLLDSERKHVIVNKKAADMLGYSIEELIGLPYVDIIAPSEYQDAKKKIGAILKGESSSLYERIFRKKDGTEFPVEINLSTIRDAGGRPLYVQRIARDITERKRAEQELKQSADKLRQALGSIVQVVASTVEQRDPYTAGHQNRVAELAHTIAIEMALSEDHIEGVYTAGIIHDIGKISVPAEILSKPSKLSEAEFSLIKDHARIGYEILKDIEFPWPIAQIVHQHHERINGSGYPLGLSGEDILIEARILGVADTVEAMASHRPYRPAQGLKTALEEISRNKGILYDLKVVDACLKVFEKKKFKLDDKNMVP